MMLKRRQDNFITGTNKLPAVTMHDQIDRLGGATRKDDFPLFARIEEMLQLAAGSLVFSRGGFRQVVHATVDVGMLSSLIMHQAIDHLLRHLAGCRIVEIDQRISLDLKFEYRKIRANAFDVERRTEPGLQGG